LASSMSIAPHSGHGVGIMTSSGALFMGCTYVM
jgi:hypothetical protein